MMDFRESSAERVLGAVMLVAFWAAFTSLAAGLALWLAFPTDDGALWLGVGLLGLLTIPMLRVGVTLAAAVNRRDWTLLAATMVVLLILTALTLRDAAAH